MIGNIIPEAKEKPKAIREYHLGENYTGMWEKLEALITFVVPAYNAEATLDRTMYSIVNQSSGQWRAIIVNDGSKDATGQIAEQYARAYSDRVTYIEQENRGLGGARNHGLELVQTSYVSFLDSDDWLMPDYVEKIALALEKASEEPEMILVLPKIYHEESKVVKKWYDEDNFLTVFPEDGIIVNPARKPLLYQFEVNQCRKILNMDFVKRIQFSFREKVKWEDVYPHFYLFSKCTGCMGVRSVGFYYRIGSSSQITASHGRDRLDFMLVMRDLTSYIEQESRDDLIFPMMRVIVRFSVWCIRMADMDIRKEMVNSLHKAYVKLPARYHRILWRECRRQYALKDALQYRLFWIAIRYKIFNFVFEDYLWQDVCEKILKKLLHAENHVA